MIFHSRPGGVMTSEWFRGRSNALVNVPELMVDHILLLQQG